MRSGCAIFAAAGMGLFTTPALAGTVTFDLNVVFSGGAGVPAGSGPWARATLTDTAGGVKLLMQNLVDPSASGTHKITGWYFNFTNIGLGNLTFTHTGGVVADGPGVNPDIETGSNAFQADGDGLYDILFNFPSSGNLLSAGTFSEYLISWDSGTLTAQMFAALSAPGGNSGGPFFTALHMLDMTNGGSNWLGSEGAIVPLPSGGAMALAGLLATGAQRRRRNEPSRNL